jgi:hypothetical protein
MDVKYRGRHANCCNCAYVQLLCTVFYALTAAAGANMLCPMKMQCTSGSMRLVGADAAAAACFESCCRVPCKFYLYAHVCRTTPLMFCSLGVTFPCQVTDLLQEWDWGNVEDSGYRRAMC